MYEKCDRVCDTDTHEPPARGHEDTARVLLAEEPDSFLLDVLAGVPGAEDAHGSASHKAEPVEL